MISTILETVVAAPGEGNLRAITPLDYAGAQVSRDKKKREAKKNTREILTDVKTKELDPIEAMILRKGIIG